MTSKTTTPGLSVQSRFVPAGQDPINALSWDQRTSMIRNPDGSFFQPGQPLPKNQISGLLSDKTTRELASPSMVLSRSKRLCDAGFLRFRPAAIWSKGPSAHNLTSSIHHPRVGPICQGES